MKFLFRGYARNRRVISRIFTNTTDIHIYIYIYHIKSKIIRLIHTYTLWHFKTKQQQNYSEYIFCLNFVLLTTVLSYMLMTTAAALTHPGVKQYSSTAWSRNRFNLLDVGRAQNINALLYHGPALKNKTVFSLW